MGLRPGDTRSVSERVKLPECMGIPVEYDPALPILSDSRGLWRWKKITVGPSFVNLPERQKGAVLLHEVGHCKCWHTERIVGYVILRPRLLWAIIAASFAASSRFEKESAEAMVWFQNEVERRAPGIAAYRRSLEAQADLYAAGCGYGADLAEVFLMMGGESGPFHPTLHERVRIAREAEPRP